MMRNSTTRFGLGCAMATPLARDGGLDAARLVAHAKALLARGCDSVTLFGTTGEGASFGLADRAQALSAFAKGGIDLRRVVVGVLASTIEDAAAQARLAYDSGCRGVLLAPPYYFKGVSEDGLYAWFASLFDRIGVATRDVILYHIPSVTQVPVSVSLVGRLQAKFPGALLGVKDSSGDWDHSQRLLDAFGRELAILIGDERHLAAAVRRGGQGCISGLANIVPELMRPMVDEGREEPRVSRLVDEVLKYPVIPAVKALLAHGSGDKSWLPVRPPLEALSAGESERLVAACDLILSAKAA